MDASPRSNLALNSCDPHTDQTNTHLCPCKLNLIRRRIFDSRERSPSSTSLLSQDFLTSPTLPLPSEFMMRVVDLFPLLLLPLSKLASAAALPPTVLVPSKSQHDPPTRRQATPTSSNLADVCNQALTSDSWTSFGIDAFFANAYVLFISVQTKTFEG